MKNLFNNIYFFVLFLFFNAVGYAQLYPVQLTPVFNSPYSVKISDYATSMDTKMQLLINPTDISISQRRVRLKLYIQGNGLNIQTSDYAQEQRPIYINGGELQTLTNVDIASLFRLENLQGITPAQYANPLPEGMYNFCFEMYDFVTNQKISQKSCANLYLILNDPPILNTPQKNEQIAATEFPNILFTWTPRQINATNISYKFELKQLLDPTLDPQIGFQMSPTLYEETLFGTAVLYNLSMPILTPGLRYAWRVRAISTTGLSENSVFKNDGYSEIYSFKYTASCAAPTFLLSESQNSKSVKITWEGVPEHTRYQVQYKKQGVRNAQWFSSNSLNRQSLITNLEPGVTYEFRVGSSCDPAEDGVQSFTYSNISTFTTPTETSGVPAYNCGIVPQINIQNQKPLTNLIQSETFKAGDFPVTILELQGENSPYSGRGYIVVPYLGDTKIAVEFKDIVINTDYQLINGIVETSYNPAWNNVVDIKEAVNDFKNLIDELDNIFSTADKISKENVELAEEFQKGKLTEEQYNDKIAKNDLLLEDSYLKTDKILDKLAESDFATEEEIDTLKKNNSSTKYASNDIKPDDVSKLAEKDTENRATILAKANEINEREEAYNEELSSFQEALKDGEYSYVNCKACTETKSGNGSVSSGNATSIEQSGKWIKIQSPPKISDKYVKCIIVNLIIENGKLKRYELGKKSIQGSSDVTSAKQEIKAFLEEIAKNSENKQSLWSNGEFLGCPALVEIKTIDPCEGKIEGFEKISQEIEDCINKAQDDKIKSDLQFITSQLRKKQEAEYYVNDSTVYRLKDNVVEKIVKPLSNEQIINGEWDDSSVESKMRFAINDNGNVALKAFGYYKELKNIDGKEIKLSELSRHITEQSNKFLEENKVKNFEAKAPIFKNDEEKFADGKQIVIGANGSSYTKIIIDGASLVGTFVKTSEVEEQTYRTSTESTATIHAPGLVTGTIESGATVVTDITSLCGMVYDLSTDKKARTEMYTGLVKLRDAVKDEPAGVIPIFVQILSGNTNDEWAEIAEKSGDEGRKGHLYSRGVVTSVKTVIAGGALITKLPSLADDLVGKIKKVSNTKFLKGIEDVLNSLDPKTLKKLSECQGFDKVLEDMTQYWTKFKGGKFQLEYAAKLVEDGKNIKFEVSNLSTIDHRIYDIEATFVENGRTITKHFELKNWNNFYPSSIKNQFVKDLASMENLGDIQWVFNKTDNISDISTLKTKVIGALKNADGTAVEALDNIPIDQVKKIVGEDFGIITGANKSKVLLKALEDESFFKKIFKIVE